MSDLNVQPVASWQVIEAGDRWYQATLRSIALAGPGEHIVAGRWDVGSPGELARWAAQDRRCPAAVIWEVPSDLNSAAEVVEVMAAISRIDRLVVQVAHLPPQHHDALALIVQEAGASFLVDDLWELEPISRRLIIRLRTERTG